jgi:hypothetical protein
MTDGTTSRPGLGSAVLEVRADVGEWKGLLVLGCVAALASVALIVVQIGIYVIWPPPETTAAFYDLLVANPVHGLLALDLLYIVSNLLAYLLYFALAVVLWGSVDPPWSWLSHLECSEWRPTWPRPARWKCWRWLRPTAGPEPPSR